jgi:hypothetical protein
MEWINRQVLEDRIPESDCIEPGAKGVDGESGVHVSSLPGGERVPPTLARVEDYAQLFRYAQDA